MKWDMVPYDVQLIGGIVLHQGKIAEMATGEGKTLVATLPLYLNALASRGAHLVTVNNYLARGRLPVDGPSVQMARSDGGVHRRHAARDARAACRLSGRHHIRERTTSSASTTCATTWWAVSSHRSNAGHVYAIIDEVDSILIDEARTPLIISGAVGAESDEKYAQFNTQVVQLVRKQTAIANDLIAKASPCSPVRTRITRAPSCSTRHSSACRRTRSC